MAWAPWRLVSGEVSQYALGRQADPNPIARCRVMLCQGSTRAGLRLQLHIEHRLDSRVVPCCASCADLLTRLVARGTRLAMTPDGAVYLAGQLDRLVRRP